MFARFVFARWLIGFAAVCCCCTQTQAGEDPAVRGVVVDAEDQPVAEALVAIRLRYGVGENDWVVNGTTNAEGKFELVVPAKWLEPGPFYSDRRVWAYAEGHALAATSASEQIDKNSNEPLEVKLAVEQPIEVKVLDPDGQPLAGTRVEPHNMQSGHIAPGAILDRVAAVSNDEGTATLRGVAPDSVRNVLATSDEFGKQRMRLGDASGEYEFTLSAVGDVEGRFTGDEVEALQGVSLSASSMGRGGGWAEGMGETTIEADGSFRIEKLAEGPYYLFIGDIENTTLRPKLPNDMVVAAGKTTELELPLLETVEVRGQVVAQDSEQQVAGAHITVRHGGIYQRENTMTDADGRFTAHVLPGEVRQNIVSLPKSFRDLIRDPDNTTTILIEEGSSPDNLPPLTLFEPMEIRGKVISESDKPLNEAFVSAKSGSKRIGYGRSDAAGEFTLRVPKGAKIDRYEVSLPRAASGEAKVVAESPLVLRFRDPNRPANVKVTATPTAEDQQQPEFPEPQPQQATLIVAKNTLIFQGRSTSWADLTEYLEQNAGVRGGELEQVYYYRTHGTYDDELRTEEARNWSSMLSDTTGVPVSERGLILNQAAQRYDALELFDVWPPGAEEPIVGRVVDTNGEPVADAQVVLLAPAPPSSRYSGMQSIYLSDGQVRSPEEHIVDFSGTDGNFEFDFPSGRTAVLVTAPAGFAMASASTKLEDIQLAPWSRVTVKLPQDKKLGVQTISLNVHAKLSGRTSPIYLYMSDGSHNSPQTDFELPFVPSGHEVVVSRTLWKTENGSTMGNTRGQGYKFTPEPGVTHHIEFLPEDEEE